MKRIIYIVLMMLLPMCAIANDSIPVTSAAKTEISKKAGDDAYSKGKFSEAVGIYEDVIKENGATKQLYYNLGNAYFREHNIGKAILNYERALKLDPLDEDAKANLEYANSLIKDEVVEEPELFFVTWWHAFVGIMGIDAWAVAAVVFFVLALIGVAMYFVNRNRVVRRVGITASVLFLFFVIVANLAAVTMYSRVNDDGKAIVLKEEVSLMNAPGASKVLMKVHEGRKVTITDDSVDKWIEVELEDGTVGWVKSDDIERI